MDKKGAIELSLNLIIMLVIGMVVLGLVIGYVTKVMSDENLPEVPKEDFKEAVCGCSDNLCLDNGELIVRIGESKSLYIKARAYSGLISCNAGNLENCEISYDVQNDAGEDVTDLIELKGEGFSLENGDESCPLYRLETSKEIKAGYYYLGMNIYEGEDFETNKKITFKVE